MTPLLPGDSTASQAAGRAARWSVPRAGRRARPVLPRAHRDREAERNRDGGDKPGRSEMARPAAGCHPSRPGRIGRPASPRAGPGPSGPGSGRRPSSVRRGSPSTRKVAAAGRDRRSPARSRPPLRPRVSAPPGGPADGDLRSRGRRGHETRAERTGPARRSVRRGSPDPAPAPVGAGLPTPPRPGGSVRRGSPDPAAALTVGLPGGPIRRLADRGSRLHPTDGPADGDLRSRGRRGRETRAPNGPGGPARRFRVRR